MDMVTTMCQAIRAIVVLAILCAPLAFLPAPIALAAGTLPPHQAVVAIGHADAAFARSLHEIDANLTTYLVHTRPARHSLMILPARYSTGPIVARPLPPPAGF